MISEDVGRSLRSLIKENGSGFPTYTKRGSEDKIKAEVLGYFICQGAGLLTPDLVSYAPNQMTVRFVEGLSAFRALELLASQRDWDGLSHLLDLLCGTVAALQNYQTDVSQGTPYDVETKMREVQSLLQLDDADLASRINLIHPRIVDLFAGAPVRFRDANPKNYILAGLHESNLTTQEERFAAQLRLIDLNTLNTLTFPQDDYVSLLYHYMVPRGLRSELLAKYRVQIESLEGTITTFVRLSRFWVRREYYRRYLPDAFIRRYPREDVDFYREQMLDSALRAVEMLS